MTGCHSAHCGPVLLWSCVIGHDPGHCWRDFPTEGAFRISPQSISPSMFANLYQPQGGGNEFYMPDTWCLGAGWRRGGRKAHVRRQSLLTPNARTPRAAPGLPTSGVLLPPAAAHYPVSEDFRWSYMPPDGGTGGTGLCSAFFH